MHDKRFPVGWRTALAIFTMISMGATIAWASNVPKILHNFGGPGDAYQPAGSLVFDSKGNLYGVTFFGTGTGCGGQGCGTIFELTPNPDGSWTEGILWIFNQAAGGSPNGPLVFDSRGNLYGTTYRGGMYDEGVAFRLTPGSNGAWTESMLHSFTGGWDGAFPEAGVVLDKTGRLYGTTASGGLNADGVALSLSQVSIFNWYELLLHPFAGGNDGSAPTAPLTFDGSGNLYGTTIYGGSKDVGTVFELMPNIGREGWTETLLYAFQGLVGGQSSDGARPYAAVVSDTSGNLYGTTAFGGSSGYGTIYELTANSNGTWTETVIYAFRGGSDGSYPDAPLTFDKAGNLYGTTQNGGIYNQGTLFKLVPSSGGQWTETIVHEFTGYPDGGGPYGGVVLDSAGNLYGTTMYGGAYGYDPGGVIYQITP